VTNLDHNSANSNIRNFQDLACPAGVEPATYGLEGLANLQNTMFNNGIQCPDLTVHQNTGLTGIDWGQMFRAWCLQAFVGKNRILGF
jgi:hypothetical protein